VLAGNETTLASHIAANCLASTEEDTVCLALSGGECDWGPLRSFVLETAYERGLKGTLEEGRLQIVPGSSITALCGLARVDEVWLLPEVTRTDGAGIAACFAYWRLAGLSEVNGVEPICGSQAGWLESLDIADHCRSAGIGYRRFRTALTFGPSLPEVPGSDEGFLAFLRALDELKAEISQKEPEYFEFHALRCWAPAAAALNLIGCDAAAERIVRFAQTKDTAGGSWEITSTRATPFARICEWISEAYDLSLLPTDECERFNAIDRLFDSRTSWLRDWLQIPAADSGADETSPAFRRLMQMTRHNLQSERAARDLKTTAVSQQLSKKSVWQGGAELTWFSGGASGTPVVIIGALGHGLEFWRRLLRELVHRHHVVIWELRGLDGGPFEFRISDHADDLEVILDQERIQSCHLVGWCTGPKIAVEFYKRHPEFVRSAVFLNGVYKWSSGPDELDTAYEHSLATFSRAIDEHPEMAGPIMKAFWGGSENETQSDGLSSEETAERVLGATNLNLRQHVLGPFCDETATIAYARQTLDFLDFDVREAARSTGVPVLMIGAEYDKVASGALARLVGREFPQARYLEVQGATHYCLYDRPQLIAGLMERFFEDPCNLNVPSGEVRPIDLASMGEGPNGFEIAVGTSQ
jgi:pimeloyl-ACP methyl ester carboxylesterase